MDALKGHIAFKGERGYSAYEIAVNNGFIGTEKDWLAQQCTDLPIVENVTPSSTNTTTIGALSLFNLLPVNLKCFVAMGDGVTDDTEAIQKAIDYCYENNRTLEIPYGVYRTNSLILKCNIKGLNNPIILFNEGEGFKNYETDGSTKYAISSIEGITFESDKSSYWDNSADVTNEAVIRKYGQRIFIGNNSQNIYATDTEDMKEGIGFWNKDYAQWIDGEDIDPDDVIVTYTGISNKNDTNIITAPDGVVISNCSFIGFGVGLTLYGTYHTKISDCNFSRNKIGIVTDNAGALPGNLSNSASKCTTIVIDKCLFSDIRYFGIYGISLLQSKIYNNIFQPVSIGVVILAGAGNAIYNNYNEIVFASVLFATNDARNCKIDNNFTNLDYATYCVYMRYGLKNEILKQLGNQNVYVSASTENNNFHEGLTLTKDDYYFYTNGNSIGRNKTKYVVFTTTGSGGTNVETTIKSSSRADGTMPLIKISNKGLIFTGTEEILSIELLQNYDRKGLLTYYNIADDGDAKLFFVEEWDSTNKTFVSKDVREDGVTYSFRVAFNDGYKSE